MTGLGREQVDRLYAELDLVLDLWPPRRPGLDVGDPCPGARHDSGAFVDSGLAARWADHYARGGPGMIGDMGYQGTGLTTPYKNPVTFLIVPSRGLSVAWPGMTSCPCRFDDPGG
ncbi:hypothetical protein ACH4OY_31820, partial [Micromonospora rubida]